MKIAFLSLNQEKLPHPVIPLGMYYMMGAIPDTYEKELWDLCFVEDYVEYIKNKLENYPADIIALGMRNIQNNDYTSISTNLNLAKDVIGLIRSLTDKPIVLGGAGFSVIPEDLMKELRPDYGIAREGEYSFLQLVKALSAKSSNLSEVPNLYFFKEDHLLFTGYSPEFLDIKSYSPEKKDYGKEYYKLTGIDSIQTKRGCPFSCDYCTYPQIEGSKFRTRDPKDIVAEMKSTMRDNEEVSHFFVVDSIFNHPVNHAKEVCREIIKQKVNCEWTCYVSPKSFNRELASLMKEAGCVGCELGSDSGNDSVLLDLKKGFKTKDIVNATNVCHEFGLLDCHTFIIGTKNETMEDVKNILKFISSLDAHSVMIMIWHDDHDAVVKHINQDRLDFKNEIIEYLKVYCKDHANWIVPEIGMNFNPKMLKFLRNQGIKGPLWQQL